MWAKRTERFPANTPTYIQRTYNVHITYIHCTYSVQQTLHQICYGFRCKHLLIPGTHPTKRLSIPWTEHAFGFMPHNCYIKSLTNYATNTILPISAKFRSKHSRTLLDQGTVLIVALATIVCRVSEANRTFPNKRCTKYRIHFGANNRANCRGEITPTAVVYIVHTLYIHIWILPLSAKLVHIELLLTQVSHG